MKGLSTTAATVVLALGLAAPAYAAVTFTVDVANSDVSLTESGGGSACVVTECGIDVRLSDTLEGTSFTLGEGDSADFDFLTFEAQGTTGPLLGFIPPFDPTRDFDITATLAFNPPVISATSTGSGGAILLGGSIIGGSLSWDSVPATVDFGNGGVATIDFQDGITILPGSSVTTKASVELDVAPVPLPAAGFVLFGALAAAGAAYRRRAA